MSTFNKVKRATVGQMVKADVTGLDNWLVGEIVSFDKTHIIFQPNDGSEPVRVVRGEVFKATADDFKKSPDVDIKAEAKKVDIKTEAKKESAIDWNNIDFRHIENYNCPHCGIGLDNGVGEHEQDINDSNLRHLKFQYACLACGEEFGPPIESTARVIIPTDRYEYQPCKAASGRPSRDNGDDAAAILRGLELIEVYELVADRAGIDSEELQSRYQHLNPGQQRMCLGNRLRKLLKV